MKQKSLFIFLLCLLLWGFFLRNASFGYYPGQNNRVITIRIELKGSYQEAIEEIITNPLEEELMTLQGIKEMQSLSEDEKATIILFFHDTMDLDQAYLKVREVVERVYNSYPDQTQKPAISKSDQNSFPVFILMLEDAAGMDEEGLKQLCRRIPGVGQVEVSGAPRKDVVLKTDSAQLDEYGITPDNIAGTIRDNNRIISVLLRPGFYMTGDFRYVNLEGFSTQILSEGLRVRDVAIPEWKNTQTESLSRVNGEDKTVIWIRQAGDANTIRLCRDLRGLRSELPASRVLYDKGLLIEEAIRNIALAIGIGILAVFLVTRIFLGSFKTAWYLSLNIPFSICGALGLLTLAGREIDMMVLSGIAIGTGMVIDSGVVFLESGKSESRKPVFYSLLSTLLVFSSLLFAPIDLREQYSGIVWSISLVLLVSMIYLFIILPGAVGIHPKKTKGSSLTIPIELLFNHINRFRIMYGLILLLSIVFSIWAVLRMPVQEEVPLDDQTLSFTVEYPAGTTIDGVAAYLINLENLLVQWTELDFYSSDIKTEKASFNLKITDPAKGKKEEIRRRILMSFDQSEGSIFFPENTEKKDYGITLLGYNRDQLYQIADDLVLQLQYSGLSEGVIMHYKAQLPILHLQLDSKSLSFVNMVPSSVFSQLSSELTHPVRAKWQPKTPLWVGQESYDVRILSGEKISRNREELENLLLRTSEGHSLSLHQLGQFTEKVNHGRIFHYNGMRGVSLSLRGYEHSDRKMIREVETFLQSQNLPEGIRIRHGEAQMKKIRSIRALGLCVALSVIIILFLLIYLFESLRIPLFLFFQIPPTLLLPMGALFLLQIPLSTPVFFGLILVIGIAINNGIVVFFTDKKKNWSRQEVIMAFQNRSASLITALFTTIAGIFPLLISGSSGNSQIFGLSVTVCLGLIFSLILLLILTPFLFRK